LVSESLDLRVVKGFSRVRGQHCSIYGWSLISDGTLDKAKLKKECN